VIIKQPCSVMVITMTCKLEVCLPRPYSGKKLVRKLNNISYLNI